MIVCYARGGGLGHLTRVRAYLHTVHPGEPARICRSPEELSLEGATELVVDAFPAGLEGELRRHPGVRVVHLARLLRWNAYRPLIPADPIRFDRTWLMEPVSEPHLTFLHEISGKIGMLTLQDPPAPAREVSGWLIVHSGPDAETLELVAYAKETAELEGVRPRFTLVSPSAPAGLPADVEHLDVYPAWPLFASADRIISAAGFNTVRQAAPYRDKHRMMPFPRRYDDQFARASQSGSGISNPTSSPHRLR